MPPALTRRAFLRQSAFAGMTGVTMGVWSGRSVAKSTSPNERLNIACVGTANQARFSIGSLTKYSQCLATSQYVRSSS